MTSFNDYIYEKHKENLLRAQDTAKDTKFKIIISRPFLPKLYSKNDYQYRCNFLYVHLCLSFTMVVSTRAGKMALSKNVYLDKLRIVSKFCF